MAMATRVAAAELPVRKMLGVINANESGHATLPEIHCAAKVPKPGWPSWRRPPRPQAETMPTDVAWALPGDIWARILALANKDGKFARRIAHFSKDLAMAACLHEDNVQAVVRGQLLAALVKVEECATPPPQRPRSLKDDLFGSDSEEDA
jgi:hypothetical protein